MLKRGKGLILGVLRATNASESRALRDGSVDMENKGSNDKGRIDSARMQSILCAFFVFLAALVIRLHHLGEMPVDRLPDSYGRWLVVQLTTANGWSYTDFKPIPNNTIVYLPLFQYIIAIAMYSAANSSIVVARLTNVLFGSLTCAVVYFLCMKIYGRKWFALVGGMLIAFQPWHVDFSTIGVAESLSSFLVILTTYSLVVNKPRQFGIASLLASLCSYEAWIVVFVELILGRFKKGWKGTRLSYAAVPLPLTILGWSVWSYFSTGNPVTWVTQTLYAMYPLGWEIHLVNPSVLLFYVNNLLVMTFFLFFIGVVFGLLKGGDTRVVMMAMFVPIVVFTFAHYVGLDFGDQARVILLMPLLSVIVPSAFPKFNGGKVKRTLIVASLLLILLIPYLSQIWIFSRKVYILAPEYRTGETLAGTYDGGSVLSDSPVVIYSSKLDPSKFRSYESLRWFLTNRNDTQLAEWLKNNNVRYLVWQKNNYTLAHQILPFLGDGMIHSVEGASFTPIYEDSLRKGHWEHDYGVPDVFVYRIDYT